MDCLGRPRPTYRGKLHLWSALLSPIWWTYQLSLCQTAEMAAAAVLSLFGTSWLFTCSGLYHTRSHTMEQEELISKFDFLGIFMQVGFSLLPVYMVLLPRTAAWLVIGGLILSVAAGTWLTFADVHVTRNTITAIYIAQGCLNLVPMATCLLSTHAVFTMLLPSEMLLLVNAVACYLVGSQVYAYATPQLWPGVFSFHELWHLLVVIASMCTWSCNNSLLARGGVGDVYWSGRAEASTLKARCAMWSAAALLLATSAYAVHWLHSLRGISAAVDKVPTTRKSPSKPRSKSAAAEKTPAATKRRTEQSTRVVARGRSRSPARRSMRRAST